MTTTITAVSTATSINHGLLIKLTVDGTEYRLANTYSPVTYNSQTYQALGHFISMGELQDDLRATNNQLSLTLSGIPSEVEGEPNYISLMLTQPIKGSRIQIYRAFFDQDGTLLSGQVYQRFSGYVSNYSLAEGNGQFEDDATNAITINCSSVHGIIERQVSGRRTNPTDFTSADKGMYRVPMIAGASFDFGKKYTPPSNNTTGGGGRGGITDSSSVEVQL